MADFSKQWTENNDPEMPWDFDIEEEFSKLNPGTYISMICEGYGFLAIGKSETGECILAVDAGVNENNEEMIRWSSYEEIVK